jgi:hypothetical protein
VRGNLLSWFGRFLSQRRVIVQWDEAESKYKQTKIFLPQGAVSSTVLFSIYISDLPECLKKIEGIKACLRTMQ